MHKNKFKKGDVVIIEPTCKNDEICDDAKSSNEGQSDLLCDGKQGFDMNEKIGKVGKIMFRDYNNDFDDIYYAVHVPMEKHEGFIFRNGCMRKATKDEEDKYYLMRYGDV